MRNLALLNIRENWNVSFLVILVCAGTFNCQGAEAPRLLPFQGRLTDQNGLAVSNSVRLVQFKIFDVSSGGSPVWAGELHRTTVNGGLVNVLLGSKTPFTGVDFDRQLYLEITVDINGDNSITAADPPMLPRQAILPVIFAKEAAISRTMFDGSVTSGKLADNSVTANKLATGAVENRHIESLGQLKIKGDQSALYHVDSAEVSRFLTGLRSDQSSVSNFVFYSYGGNWIFKNGNVSIGAGTPEENLTVSGSASPSIGLQRSDNGRKATIKSLNTQGGVALESPLGDQETDAIAFQFSRGGDHALVTIRGQGDLDVNGRILRKGRPFSSTGTANNGESIVCPWGTVLDWNIFVSPQELGLTPVPQWGHNSIQRFICKAIPHPNNPSAFLIEVRWEYNDANTDVRWLDGKANYLLIPK